MKIQLNGQEREVTEGDSVAELVAALDLLPEQVAVELNRTLVPRRERAATLLKSGDEIELVTLVGGG